MSMMGNNHSPYSPRGTLIWNISTQAYTITKNISRGYWSRARDYDSLVERYGRNKVSCNATPRQISENARNFPKSESNKSPNIKWKIWGFRVDKTAILRPVTQVREFVDSKNDHQNITVEIIHLSIFGVLLVTSRLFKILLKIHFFFGIFHTKYMPSYFF